MAVTWQLHADVVVRIQEEHAEFLRRAPQFEDMLASDGISLTKFWFSVSPAEQRTRFAIRQVDPVRQWKLSPTDIESLDKWDDYTEAKEEMFMATDTDYAPWIVVKSNDKKRARLNAMRYLLNKFDYEQGLRPRRRARSPDRRARPGGLRERRVTYFLKASLIFSPASLRLDFA
jgi:hypothetical protein